MATMKVDIFSKSLEKNVQFNVYLPIEERWEDKCRSGNFPTLYLLHGYSGNENDWISRTSVLLYAREKGVAVVMPAGDNQYYLDGDGVGFQYGTFVGEELVQMTRELFPLSHKREETYIAGLSMGGYGAMRNGLKYHETFSAIGAFSSAFIIDALIRSTKGTEEETIRRNIRYYEKVFGPLDKLEGSDKDYKVLIEQLQEEKKAIPRLWMTCGTEDFLLKENRSFYEFLKANYVSATYIEESGGHEWPYWDRAIKQFIQWL